MRQSIRAAQSGKCFGQPRPRHDARPVGIGARCAVWSDMCAGQHAHRFSKREAALRRCVFGLSKVDEHVAEFIPINFDPATAHQCKTIRSGE